MQFMQVVPGLPFGTMFRALISGYNLTNVKVTGSNLAVPASGDATAGERRGMKKRKGMEDLSAVSIL
jgi:hypothetical protein